MKLVLSDHVWALKKWPLNTGGLCAKLLFGTKPSGLYRGGLWIQVVFKTGFTVLFLNEHTLFIYGRFKREKQFAEVESP